MFNRRYFLIILFIGLLISSGCDTLIVKRIDINKQNNQLNNYLKQRSTIISIIDSFIIENNLSCKPRSGLIRYCDQIPKTLVAFEDDNNFTICLFMLGPTWEKNKFYSLSSKIEKSLINEIPSIHVNKSLPGESLQCSIPSE